MSLGSSGKFKKLPESFKLIPLESTRKSSLWKKDEYSSEFFTESFESPFSQMMDKYDSGYSTQYAYDQVIEEFCKDNLSLSSSYKSLMFTKFNDSDGLESRLSDKEFMTNFSTLAKRFPHEYGDSFSIKLGIFILKCFLIMRQKYPKIHEQDQEKWKETLTNMKPLESALGDYSLSFTFILQWNLDFSHDVGIYFFKIECLRRWNDDFGSKFERFIDDFYSKESGSCLEIISNHFNGGKKN